MKTYKFSVVLNVEVEAFTEEDAKEALHDCLGEGDTLGLNILDFEVVEDEV